MKIEVTFPKLHQASFLSGGKDHYELETFTYECDPSMSGHDNLNAAYEEAVRRGHNPNKNIRFRALPDYDGEPCPCCNKPMTITNVLK